MRLSENAYEGVNKNVGENKMHIFRKTGEKHVRLKYFLYYAFSLLYLLNFP